MSKKYYEFMKQISSEDLYKGLLGFGLFSEKLPPFLSSVNFFEYCQKNDPTFSNTKKEQSFIYYENMRNINIPRPLGIPNPMAYQKLCMNLKDNWDNILEPFKVKTQDEEYKVSRIHIRKLKDKSKIFEMNYGDFKNDGNPEQDLLIGSKFLVNADISTCFPSIYSHSISWALVSKGVAKLNKGKSNEWYNALDFYVRNTKNGETNGLLIGPHSSNLISEIILTAIDYEMVKKGWQYLRNIDDYTCYVKSFEDGQQFLLDLIEQLRGYNLILNFKKTKITPLPIASVEHWVRKLSTHSQFKEKDVLNFQDVRSFLDLSIELMNENANNSAILNFAIKVLSKKHLSKNAIDYYVKTINHLTIIYPYLIALLDENIFKVFKVEIEKIKSYSKLFYKEGILNNNFELVSYSIYFALKYDFVINKIDFTKLRQNNHCIVLLLSYLYCDRNKINSEVKELLARELVKDEEDFNQYWLFVFEVLSKSHLKGDWKNLKDNNVTFVSNFIGKNYSASSCMRRRLKRRSKAHIRIVNVNGILL
ncbi:hypothetical protein CN692_10855 [Bacillus sp. AFS002410]|uniref:RNA-directed DNA polymerase n=1 Tax=Bacillus sp. AFS002410 TaxID=2033481 RepID=UPI000BEF7B1E|nr:RNA-directed DNA polymerase [Bacillus sp. AFS002410]PEJ57982.1 hypothetical protein CN692_10855 [Bacillus sp. AFS002410]